MANARVSLQCRRGPVDCAIARIGRPLAKDIGAEGRVWRRCAARAVWTASIHASAVRAVSVRLHMAVAHGR